MALDSKKATNGIGAKAANIAYAESPSAVSEIHSSSRRPSLPLNASF
jgi:hypothetical protein